MNSNGIKVFIEYSIDSIIFSIWESDKNNNFRELLNKKFSGKTVEIVIDSLGEYKSDIIIDGDICSNSTYPKD